MACKPISIVKISKNQDFWKSDFCEIWHRILHTNCGPNCVQCVCKPYVSAKIWPKFVGFLKIKIRNFTRFSYNLARNCQDLFLNFENIFWIFRSFCDFWKINIRNFGWFRAKLYENQSDLFLNFENNFWNLRSFWK